MHGGKALLGAPSGSGRGKVNSKVPPFPNLSCFVSAGIGLSCAQKSPIALLPDLLPLLVSFMTCGVEPFTQSNPS